MFGEQTVPPVKNGLKATPKKTALCVTINVNDTTTTMTSA